jgi:hypothetical protein
MSEWCYEMKDARPDLRLQFSAAIRATVEGLMAQRAGMLSYGPSTTDSPKKLKKLEKQLCSSLQRVIEAADINVSETAAHIQYLHYREHLQTIPTTGVRRLASYVPSPLNMPASHTLAQRGGCAVALRYASSPTSPSTTEFGGSKRDPALVYLGEWVATLERLDRILGLTTGFVAIRDKLVQEVSGTDRRRFLVCLRVCFSCPLDAL